MRHISNLPDGEVTEAVEVKAVDVVGLNSAAKCIKNCLR